VRGPYTCWIDEAYGVSSASWAPAGLLELVTGGRGLGHGVVACSQRPRNIAKELLTEADHLMLFPPVDVEDVKECLRGAAFLPVAKAIELLNATPRHGFLWIDKKRQTYALAPPLPAHERERDAGIVATST
jgi:hypothetical protein